MNLSAILRDFMQKNNYTQTQMAEKVGVSASAIHAWLHNAGTPCGDNLARLTQVLELPSSITGMEFKSEKRGRLPNKTIAYTVNTQINRILNLLNGDSILEKKMLIKVYSIRAELDSAIEKLEFFNFLFEDQYFDDAMIEPSCTDEDNQYSHQDHSKPSQDNPEHLKAV